MASATFAPMIRLGCFLMAAFYTAYVVLAFKYLDAGWAILAVLALVGFTLYALPKLLVRGATGWIQRKAIGLMDAKSAVLRDAQIQVESLDWIERPSDNEEELDEDDEPIERPAHLLRMTASIRPAGSAEAGKVLPKNQTPMQFYEPGELILVPANAPSLREKMSNLFGGGDGDSDDEDRVNPEVEDIDDDGDESHQAHCVDARILGEENEGADKVAGINRVKLDFDVPAEMTGPVKPRYYMEDFPAFDLPPRPLPPATPLLEV